MLKNIQHHLLLKVMQEKLNWALSLHLISQQVPVMVKSEHLLEVGIHSPTQHSHSYFLLGICGMLVVLSSKIFGLGLLFNHYNILGWAIKMAEGQSPTQSQQHFANPKKGSPHK